MRRFRRKTLTLAVAGAAALCMVLPALADIADVYLKSGVRLRGDVTTTAEAVIVRNAAGELRLPWADVARLVPVELPVSQPAVPATRPAVRTETPGTEAKAPARAELPPAPPLSDEDIQRLKMEELPLDGPAETVRVRFVRKGRQPDLATEVLEELQQRAEYRPEWEEVLARGQAYEKLQLIVRTTGTEHADRIVIEGDPRVFATFRRRILPLVDKSCARAGCHAGRAARVFRFPAGSLSSDTYAYTTFVLLDQMEAQYGPLLDRNYPEESVLLNYLLPQRATEKGHPPVGRGPAFQAVIRDLDDPLYMTVLSWISALRLPHPNYGLSYRNPYAAPPAAPAGAGADEPAETPAVSPPTTHPAGEPAP
jgi:hypothetical protein